MAFVKRTITVREDQDAWLKAHPEINISGHIRRWLDNLIEAYAQA